MSEDEFKELVDLQIQEMVADGSLILSGLEENGDPYYNMNPDLMKILHPAFYEIMMEELDQTLIDLYMDGLVNVEYDENLSPLFSISEQGLQQVEMMLKDENGQS